MPVPVAGMVVVGRGQAVVVRGVGLCVRGVDGRPEVVACEPAVRVLGAERHRVDGVGCGVAVGRRPARVNGRDVWQPRVVGIAAHDAVQDDDVRWLDRVRCLRDVDSTGVTCAVIPELSSERAASTL